MKNFLLKLILFAVAVYVAAMFVPGIDVLGVKGAIISSLVLGLLNTFVRPVLKLLSLPITIITLGLFSLVINALMIELCAWIVPGSIFVSGFIAALIFGIVLGVVCWILNTVFVDD